MSEDITTIFVVGFPDDMKEREFQNMFTFSPGFEAATLKLPSGDDATDKDSQKKQIIGFAKFHTRLEALEARDILTGRKIDSEKNCILKAEMAKKNLHTRRGLSSLGLSTAMATTFGLDTPSTALGFQQQAQQQQQSQAPPQMQLQPGGAGPAGQNVPRTASLTGSNMLSSASRPDHLRISASRAFNLFNDIPLASAPILGAGSHRSFSSSQFSSAFSNSGIEASGASSNPPIPGTAGVMGGFMFNNDQSNLTTTGPHSSSGLMLNRRGSVHGMTSVSSSLGMSASTAGANGLQHPQQQQQQSQLPQPSQTQLPQQSQTQMPQQPPKGYGSQRPAVLDIAALQPRISQLSLGQMSASSLMSPMGMPYSASLSTPTGMVLPMATTRSVNSNDQNPPCNTLYVGNLPVGAKEEELRKMFQCALGFKRMSYKAKPNSGPMCFVEFESIDFATLAMNDLDGRMLTNSMGGGIRLSYSKNPLGVRSQNSGSSNGSSGMTSQQQQQQAPSTPVLNSAAIAAAAAAMANGYHHLGGATTPYGYSVAALQAQQIQQLQQQQQQLQQHQSQHHQDATPSPPGSALMGRNAGGLAPPQHQAVGNHRHSLSSSSAASPLPSPSTAKSVNSGDQTAVPKDALSFLHQPLHQLHKQAPAEHPISSTGSVTPPQTSNGVSHMANIALDK
ncbi:hypothetical protein GGI07_000230 [Coemansia sp. Benny D115]|nr:hypothetical protein GGI07_000230 [Coemansia sp. Benny D115]